MHMARTRNIFVAFTLVACALLAAGAVLVSCAPQQAGNTGSTGTVAGGDSSRPAASTAASTTASTAAGTAAGTGADADDQLNDGRLTDGTARAVACVGDSITYGSGLAHPEADAWPALLQQLLGGSWSVANLGVPGATLLDDGPFPYRSTGNVQRAKDLRPAVAIIMLGTNDAFAGNWDEGRYRDQLAALVDELRASNPAVQVVLMAPPCTFYEYPDSVARTGEERIGGQVRSAVGAVAAEKDARFIDLYALTEDHPDWFPDDLHPNEEGHRAIADAVNAAFPRG